MYAPFLDDHLRFLKTVEDFAIEALVPEFLLCRSGLFARKGNRLALCLQHLNLAKLRHDLLRHKSFLAIFFFLLPSRFAFWGIT